jgi:hypothetical protein
MNTYRLTIKTEDIKRLKEDFAQLTDSKLYTIGNTSKVASFDAQVTDEDISYLKLRYKFILFYDRYGSSF